MLAEVEDVNNTGGKVFFISYKCHLVRDLVATFISASFSYIRNQCYEFRHLGLIVKPPELTFCPRIFVGRKVYLGSR
jgi:hypothetical protein